MKQIGLYQIRGKLGQGKMAQVYRAYDPRLEREVALKVICVHFLGNKQFYLRFKQEAKLIATLKHPAVVPLYDFGKVDDQPYLVMRLMSGGSLAERLKAKGKGFSLSDLLELVNRLADALDMAHQKGIVHRDLKPANILFDEQGDAYFSDFGLGKLLEYTNVGLNRTDIPLGTLAYMSPEQARGDRRIIDGRSDLYSLAVMLFELLTGQLPFKTDVPASLIYKHISAPVPNICEIRADLPQSCQTLIQRAMAKKPAERYATAGEMATALKKVLAESLSTPHRLQTLLQSKGFSQLLCLLFMLGAVRIIAPQIPPMPSLTALLPNEQPSFAANPQEAAIYLEDGEEFYRKGEYNQASQELSEAIPIPPNQPTSYYLRAMAYFSNGEYQKAVDDYSQALILDSTLEEAYYYRGQAYEGQKLFVLALADYKAAIRLNPTNSQYHLSLADAQFISSSYDEAIVSYDEATRLNPNDARPYYGLGNAYQGKEAYQQALSSYTEAIRLDRQFMKAYYHRGLLYAEQEDYQNAIADYSEAIRLNRQYDTIYFHRAQSYEQIGNLEAAITDYKNILQINHEPEVMASAQAALERLSVE
jgi:serine/threonine-protein kinase